MDSNEWASNPATVRLYFGFHENSLSALETLLWRSPKKIAGSSVSVPSMHFEADVSEGAETTFKIALLARLASGLVVPHTSWQILSSSHDACRLLLRLDHTPATEESCSLGPYSHLPSSTMRETSHCHTSQPFR